MTDYAVRIAVAHAVLGLLLAGLLHWGVRFSSPRPPSGWRWWASAGLLFVLLFGMGHAQQLYIFPAMYDVVPNVAGLVDSVSLAQIQAVTAGVWMLVLGAVLLRWRASEPGWGQRMGRAALPLAAWSGLVGLSLSNPAPTESQDNQAMNVVILGVDSLRPDHLGFYGYDRDTAPHIDALLKESVTFDSAWTPLARTYPAWTSMLSGLLPINNGIRDNLPEPDEVVPKVPLLPAVLQKRGSPPPSSPTTAASRTCSRRWGGTSSCSFHLQPEELRGQPHELLVFDLCLADAQPARLQHAAHGQCQPGLLAELSPDLVHRQGGGRAGGDLRERQALLLRRPLLRAPRASGAALPLAPDVWSEWLQGNQSPATPARDRHHRRRW